MTDIERLPVGGVDHLARRNEIVASLADRVPVMPRAVSPVDVELAETRALYELCAMYVRAGDMLPRAFRAVPAERGRPEVTPEQAAARLAIVARTGRTFGWDVLTSVRMLDNIDGQPKLKTEALIALVRRAGHRIDIDDQGHRVTVTGRRADDGSTMTVTWDEDRAKTVPHTAWENGQRRKTTLWAKWVESGQTAYMLRWRALSELGRFLFSDVTLGLAGDWDDVTPVDDAPEVPVARPALLERVQAKVAEIAPAPPVVEQPAVAEQPAVIEEAANPPAAGLAPVPEAGDTAVWAEVAKAAGIRLPALIEAWGAALGVRNWVDVAKLPDDERARVWDWLHRGVEAQS